MKLPRASAATPPAVAPIRLTGGPALDALPGSLPSELRALFDPDEIVPRDAMPTRTLQAGVRRDLADADPILSAERTLFIGRSDCELADQWLAARLPSLVATARDELLFSGVAELAECAKRPVAAFRSEFFRPMYFGDRGRIHVTAYRKGTQIVVAYHVRAEPVADAEGPLCALAVEAF